MAEKEPLRIKWKPYSTVEPSSKPKVADSVLDTFFGVVNDVGLRACLAYGLCLGFVRDKDYIPGDNDLDVVLINKEGKLTPTIQKSFEKAGFARRTSYPPPSNNVHFVKDFILVDVYFRVAGEYYITFGKVRRNGKVYPIPHPIDGYLKACYGAWGTKGTISTRYR